MKNKQRDTKGYMLPAVMLLLLTIFLYQCSELRDDIPSMDTACQAAGCHLSTILKSSLPVTGKHSAHLNINYDCNYCHYNYLNNSNHKNGINDFNNGARVVFFDTSKAGGSAYFTDNTNTTGEFYCEISCHPGAPSADWYRTDTPNWDCDVCHNSAKPNRRQIVGAGGDFGQNAARVSHHISGGADPTKAQCLVCHDQSTHASGTVRLRNADTGAAIVYNSANPSILEPFCLSCHDPDGAITTFAAGGSALNPFNDGQILGAGIYVAGDKIAGYWNNSYTVHKDNGLTCAGTGNPNSGCHGSDSSINIHGSTSKGILTRNMTFPVPHRDSDPLPRNPDNPAYVDYIGSMYKLCFDCHEGYSGVKKEIVFGYMEGGNYDLAWAPTPYYMANIQSLFRDVWTGGPDVYDDTIWGDPNTPLHNYHLLTTDNMMQYVWAYRGDPGQKGRASCTTCHNVHGTAGTVRSTYDEFGITAFSNGGDYYKKFVPDTNYDDAVMTNYPIYCAVNCHGTSGQRYYWHTPASE